MGRDLRPYFVNNVLKFRIMATPWSAIIGGATSLVGSALNFGSARKNRQMQIQLNRENNQFNAEQAQIQRDWQENVYNNYQSPQALRRQYEEAGYNPYLAMSQGAGSVGSGSAASAAGTPSLQAPQLDVSSIGSTMASVAEAIKISKEASYTDLNQIENLNFLRAQGAKLQGDTNWLNRFGKDVQSTPELRNLSEQFIRKQATGEMERIDLANDLLGQQKVLYNLDAQAKAITNKYLPQTVCNDLALQASQISRNLADVSLTEAKTATEREQRKAVIQSVATSLAQMYNTLEDTVGKRLGNRIAQDTMWSYITASNAENSFRTVQSNIDKSTYNEYKEAFISELQSRGGLNEARSEEVWNSIFNRNGSNGRPFRSPDRAAGKRSPGPIVRSF